jgi:hypothetical protein
MEKEEDITSTYKEYIKGNGYWDIVKELYNAISDIQYTKPNKVSNSKTTHITKGILNHIKGNGSTLHYSSHSVNVPEVNDKRERLFTIKNPEELNTGDKLVQGHWGITYGGRDLTLDKDNYHWIVTNRRNGFKGHYIIGRELISNDWLNVRWGSGKIRKEMSGTIHKSYLKDKVKFQWDIVTHIVQMMPITKGNTHW